jgi:hypothetical protein
VRSTAVAALFLALAGAAPAPERPRLDLNEFFAGRTHADNDLKIVFHRTSKLIVDSVGRREGKEFVLIDTVHEGDKPVRTRKWVTHEVVPGRISGTLSDAIGPVDIVVSGDTATIRYVMQGGLNIVEKMQLRADGRTLSNHVEARKFGLQFAHVDGTIRKLD